MTNALVEPIPWTFTDEPGLLQWAWVTGHFVARVSGVEVAGQPDPAQPTGGRRLIKSYHWELADLMRTHQGMPRVLVEGTNDSFEDAEAAIREHVGKCYDARLGYRAFAGPLAFTYSLATGDRVDVSGFIGTRCTVTVLRSDRTHQTVIGDFDVHHYRWRIRTEGDLLEIVPEHVMSITNRSEAAQRASEIAYGSTYSGIGRIYREEFRAGCTGRPGYAPLTVDHARAPRCPLHEAGVPDHLLR